MLVLNSKDILSNFSASHLIDSMRDAMLASSLGKVCMPGRNIMPLVKQGGGLGLMPGASYSPNLYGLKVISVLPHNLEKGFPVISGAFLYFDSSTGKLLSLIDAASLTSLRTAAITAMATESLARKDSKVAAIFGCGVQAKSHIEALMSLENIEKIIIWARDLKKAKAFCQSFSSTSSYSIEFVESAQRAAEIADVICTVTGAEEPILKGEWVRPGTHINLIGSHDVNHKEADDELLAAARLFTDHTPFAVKEAGEFVSAIKSGKIKITDICAEIGDVINGDHQGRNTPNEITLYKSLGLISQDLFAADFIYERANKLAIGTQCEF